MSADEFTKLFRYVQEQFEVVNQKLDKTASQESLDRNNSSRKSLTSLVK